MKIHCEVCDVRLHVSRNKGHRCVRPCMRCLGELDKRRKIADQINFQCWRSL